VFLRPRTERKQERWRGKMRSELSEREGRENSEPWGYLLVGLLDENTRFTPRTKTTFTCVIYPA
jgi:hypothetical protein